MTDLAASTTASTYLSHAARGLTPQMACAPAYHDEIEAFVADRAEEFDVELPRPWDTALSASDLPRPLLDELCVATVARRAAQALTHAPSSSPDDAIEAACDALPVPWGSPHHRSRLFRRARTLLLRAQVRSAAPTHDAPPVLVEQVRALQSHWEARTAALAAFASTLDSITEQHGEGLVLTGDAARRKQHEVNRAAYAEVRRLFVEHHSGGLSQVAIDDQEISSLVLDTDPSLVALFTPERVLALLHARFGRTAQDLLCQQVADAFVDAFWLRRDSEVRVQRGRVVLQLRVWIDSIDKAHLRRIRYSYDSRSRIEKALRALAELWLQGRSPEEAVAAGDAVRACLRTFEAADWSPTPALRPSLLGVELRCFQGRIDVLVPEAFAAQINAFVTLHSKRLLERA